MKPRPVITLTLPPMFPIELSALVLDVAKALDRVYPGGQRPFISPVKQMEHNLMGSAVDVKIEGVEERIDFEPDDLSSAIERVVYNAICNVMASRSKPRPYVQVRCFNDLGTLIGSASSEDHEEVVPDMFKVA